MTNSRNRKTGCLASSRHQRGMTLLVGLVLLVMLSVIGTIGFRNTTMTERMTGNSYDRSISFQSAESSGKEALTAIESGTAAAMTSGYYATPLAQGGTSNFWTQGDGAAVSAGVCATTTPFSWQSCSASVGTKYSRDSSNAQYVIELLSATSSGGSTVSSYRITSRSKGGSGNSDIVLQTNYSRTTTP